MFGHILLATDGSDLSQKAIDAGIALARALGAKVTAVTVTAPLHSLLAHQAGVHFPDYEEKTAARASEVLAEVESAAGAAQVACETVHVRSQFPHVGIVDVAIDKGCDLIVMSSHGRRGVSAFLLGSETQKVLTHSKIPVLVHR
jgi:nucleotide-binding universal stress UspA family protein